MTNAKKKILIIRFSSIGDIVLTTPVVRCINKQWNAEIHFLTKKNFAGILEKNPHIYKIHIKEEINLNQLKEEKFDFIVDLQKNMYSSWIGWRLPGKYIGFDKINIQKWLLVNFSINYLPKKHLIDRYFEALHPAGIFDDGMGCDFFINMEKVAGEISGLQHTQFDIIVLGAAHATKRLSIKKVREIVKLAERTIVLIGGNDVAEMAKLLKSEFPLLVNRTGKDNLHESAFLISCAQIVFTGDTGMMHISAALQKKTIVLWGNTVPDFGMFPYYGSRYPNKSLSLENINIHCRPCSKLGFSKCPKVHFKCMEDINVDPEMIKSFRNE